MVVFGRLGRWFPWWSVFVALSLLATGWLFAAMRLSQSGDLAILWWFPLTGSVIVVGSMLVHGLKPTSYAAIASMFVVGSIWQLHAGIRMTYLDGDTAIDTMIYNTTSLDMNQLARDLQTTSLLMTGDYSLQIQIESCNSIDWPQRWYFRDMPNASYSPTLAENLTQLAPVVIGSLPEWSSDKCHMPESIPGYTVQQLAFRWHEPESSVYRQFAIAPELEPYRSAWKSEERLHDPIAIVESIFDSLAFALTPDGQRRLIELLMYRQMDAGVNAFYVNVYVRNDVLPYYNEVRYGIESGCAKVVI